MNNFVQYFAFISKFNISEIYMFKTLIIPSQKRFPDSASVYALMLAQIRQSFLNLIP